MVGIYGVIAHAVTQRTKEIGIRMALGATPFTLLVNILGHSVALTGVGTAVGLLVAAAVTRYLESLLFGLTPLDVSTFGGVALLFAIVAVLAAYLPASRASHVNPIVALRHD
jgi:ABC-type antimicrobial peptide transport system permease subunit